MSACCLRVYAKSPGFDMSKLSAISRQLSAARLSAEVAQFSKEIVSYKRDELNIPEKNCCGEVVGNGSLPWTTGGKEVHARLSLVMRLLHLRTCCCEFGVRLVDGNDEVDVFPFFILRQIDDERVGAITHAGIVQRRFWDRATRTTTTSVLPLRRTRQIDADDILS